jgi:hypothetical protein
VKMVFASLTGLFTRPGFAGDACGSGLGLHSARPAAPPTPHCGTFGWGVNASHCPITRPKCRNSRNVMCRLPVLHFIPYVLLQYSIFRIIATTLIIFVRLSHCPFIFYFIISFYNADTSCLKNILELFRNLSFQATSVKNYTYFSNFANNL